MNTTSSGNRNSESTEITTVDACLFVLALLLSFFICTVNIVTILLLWRTETLRTLANLYLASLAAADLVVGLGLVPMALFLLPPTRVSLFNRYSNLCVLMSGLNLGMAGNSVIHMAFVSVDRYLFISRPYTYQRVMNVRVVVINVTSAWVIGVSYTFLPQFIHQSFTDGVKCDVTELLPMWYLAYGAWGFYFTSVAVILIMYSLILRTAFKQRKSIQSVAPFGAQANGNSRGTISKSTLKSLKFFVTVFGIFFLCMTPIVISLGVDYYVNVPVTLYRILVMLALTNSGMNFVIFTVQNGQFRRAVFKFFRCYSLIREQNDDQAMVTTIT